MKWLTNLYGPRAIASPILVLYLRRGSHEYPPVTPPILYDHIHSAPVINTTTEFVTRLARGGRSAAMSCRGHHTLQFGGSHLSTPMSPLVVSLFLQRTLPIALLVKELRWLRVICAQSTIYKWAEGRLFPPPLPHWNSFHSTRSASHQERRIMSTVSNPGASLIGQLGSPPNISLQLLGTHTTGEQTEVDFDLWIDCSKEAKVKSGEFLTGNESDHRFWDQSGESNETFLTTSSGWVKDWLGDKNQERRYSLQVDFFSPTITNIFQAGHSVK